MNDSTGVSPAVAGVSAGTATLFIGAVGSHMIPWLIVMAAVILCDLVFGIRRAWLAGERVRFSKACRDTAGKTVMYFAFVCMVCAVEQAAGGGYGIDKWSCLAVCLIEGCSIFSNFLKTKGVDVNVVNILNAVFRKATSLDADGVFTEGDREKKDS